MNTISRDDLIQRIKNARFRLRFLGVLAVNLDWKDFRVDWLNKVDNGELYVEIVREAEHFASNASIITSNKKITSAKRSYQYGNLKRIIDAPLQLRQYLVDNNCKNLEPCEDINKDDYKQHFVLRTCYLNIPTSIVNIDDDYFAHIALTNFIEVDTFEIIDEDHHLKEEIHKYIDTYFENFEGGRIYSTEETAKGNRLEVINAFNFNREVMFPLPRDSFPDTKFAKLVVWALMFTRDGKLLLHRRGKNAKDNQGLWDKSVGGHVSTDDVDTVKAIGREIVEELYKHEHEEQGGHNETEFFVVNEDKMIFLGEWNPEKRSPTPFEDYNNQRGENFYFRLNYNFSKVDHDTRRLLPNGEYVTAHTFIDLYVCLVSKDFQLDTLKNSKYMLVELHELYDSYLDKRNPINNEEEFEVTPDLDSILRSTKLFDELSEFADYVKEAEKNIM